MLIRSQDGHVIIVSRRDILLNLCSSTGSNITITPSTRWNKRNSVSD